MSVVINKISTTGTLQVEAKVILQETLIEENDPYVTFCLFEVTSVNGNKENYRSHK